MKLLLLPVVNAKAWNRHRGTFTDDTTLTSSHHLETRDLILEVFLLLFCLFFCGCFLFVFYLSVNNRYVLQISVEHLIKNNINFVPQLLWMKK